MKKQNNTQTTNNEQQTTNPDVIARSDDDKREREEETTKQSRTSLDSLLKEIEELKTQVDQYKSQALRALADYQNLERRMHAERQTVVEQANMHLLRELVGMKEDMDKAEVFDKNPGLALVIQKMTTLFKKFSVTELDVLGKEFSPDTMECINVEAGEKDNVVTNVHEKGYILHGKLLRPARVTVSKLQVSQPQAE
ncbi:MAG: nucleotide exchange factor GrpE [Patescibacteria group bacterium]|jgi:molecular chaperone GrpE